MITRGETLHVTMHLLKVCLSLERSNICEEVQSPPSYFLSIVLTKVFDHPCLLQQMFLRGFAGDIAKAQARATMLAGEAISNIRTVVAFNAEAKVLGLYEHELEIPMQKNFWRGQVLSYYAIQVSCNSKVPENDSKYSFLAVLQSAYDLRISRRQTWTPSKHKHR